MATTVLMLAIALSGGACSATRPHGDASPLNAPFRLEADEDGVLFRLAMGEHGHLSLEAGGRLVNVTDTSVMAGPEDYRAWQLSPHGVERVVAAVEEDLNRTQAPDRLDGSLVFGWVTRPASADLAARLYDPSWLGDDLLAGPDPWIPDHLTVYASPGLPPAWTGPPVPWPYPDSIRARNDGQGSEHGPPETLICLDGDEVAPLFALLDGVNIARVAVDDGEVWELTVRPSYPGYGPGDDACSE